MFDLFNLTIGFVIGAFLIKILMPIMKLYFVDQPNDRSSHLSPKPTGGGIIFLILTLISYSFLFLLNIFWEEAKVNTIPLICLPIGLLGLLDDKFNLSNKLRFSVQIITNLYLLLHANLNIISGDIWMSSALIFLILLISTSIVNFTNFMDGIDGLVGGCMFVILSYTAYRLESPWIIWILIGGILGFLWWNWFPAKIFMGDAGSTFLGTIYVGLLFASRFFFTNNRTWFIILPIIY